MITYETLKTYKEKCEAALGEVSDAIVEARESLEMLEKQQIAIEAQIETLNNLMNTEENPPIVELPFAGPDDIEKVFDKRLETYDGSPPEEIYGERQDNVYLKEAMEAVDKLDAANRDNSEEDCPWDRSS